MLAVMLENTMLDTVQIMRPFLCVSVCVSVVHREFLLGVCARLCTVGVRVCVMCVFRFRTSRPFHRTKEKTRECSSVFHESRIDA